MLKKISIVVGVCLLLSSGQSMAVSNQKKAENTCNANTYINVMWHHLCRDSTRRKVHKQVCDGIKKKRRSIDGQITIPGYKGKKLQTACKSLLKNKTYKKSAQKGSKIGRRNAQNNVKRHLDRTLQIYRSATR